MMRSIYEESEAFALMRERLRRQKVRHTWTMMAAEMGLTRATLWNFMHKNNGLSLPAFMAINRWLDAHEEENHE